MEPDEGGRRERYNPYMLQSLRYLSPEELLRVIAIVSVKMCQGRGCTGVSTFSKKEVENIIGEALEAVGKSSYKDKLASKKYPFLLNDLRRIGIIVAGDPHSSWRDSPARPGRLARRVADALEYCVHSCGDETRCQLLAGTVAITGLIAGLGEGSYDLRDILSRICVGHDMERLAAELSESIGGGKPDSAARVDTNSRLRQMLRRHVELVNTANRLAWDVLREGVDGCSVPVLYLAVCLGSESPGQERGE